ncbi:MAG: hypothetical protein KGI27_01735 [Thaumarchaeota archaeon]|nr:hypothetical protein [Nitrososphaerota archaeon]
MEEWIRQVFDGPWDDIWNFLAMKGNEITNEDLESIQLKQSIGFFLLWAMRPTVFEEIITLTTAKKLIKKTPKDLFNDNISNDKYNLVMNSGFTNAESHNKESLHEQKPSGFKGFFKRFGNNNDKQETISIIEPLVPSILKPIPKLEEKVFIDGRKFPCFTCENCLGEGIANATYKIGVGPMYNGPDFQPHYSKYKIESRNETCWICKGSGEKVYDPRYLVKKYGKMIDKINEEIIKTLERVSEKIPEYNKLVNDLNEKIEIYNKKYSNPSIDYHSEVVRSVTSHVNYELCFLYPLYSNLDKFYKELEASAYVLLTSANIVLKNDSNNINTLFLRLDCLLKLARYEEAIATIYEIGKIRSDKKKNSDTERDLAEQEKLTHHPRQDALATEVDYQETQDIQKLKERRHLRGI